MTTERFRQALNDLKEVLTRGGLAQNMIVKETIETQQALTNKIWQIGTEDGMTDGEINSILHEYFVNAPAQK